MHSFEDTCQPPQCSCSYRYELRMSRCILGGFCPTLCTTFQDTNHVPIHKLVMFPVGHNKFCLTMKDKKIERKEKKDTSIRRKLYLLSHENFKLLASSIVSHAKSSSDLISFWCGCSVKTRYSWRDSVSKNSCWTEFSIINFWCRPRYLRNDTCLIQQAKNYSHYSTATCSRETIMRKWVFHTAFEGFCECGILTMSVVMRFLNFRSHSGFVERSTGFLMV